MEHKVLDWLQHLSFYIGGVFAIFSAIFGFWWHDRKESKKEVREIRTLVLHMKDNMATRGDLRECSKEKDDQHHEGIKDVLSELQGVRSEIRDGNKDNSQQHQDLHKEISGVLKVVAGLRNGD